MTRVHAPHLAYRPDVDGLRAVAVSSVLVFHAFPELLPGGFVGVDIFFVISGYLISKILATEIRERRFSLWRFYERRVRRILPALLLVLVVCLVGGWFALFEAEFKKLGSYELAGLLSVGNLRNLKATGYFDSAGDLTPMLHLWSLGVEEQYYLVWPLLLLVAYSGPKRGRRLLAAVLAMIGLSFLLNVALVRSHPTAAFYLPVTRVWQLAIGAFLACRQVIASDSAGVEKPSPAATSATLNVLSVAGALMLGASLLLIDKTKSFPGFWALLPTLGSAIAIGAGPDAWINRHLLGSRLCVGIGLISYPLYLWHWPVLSFARILIPRQIPASVLVALLLFSVALAWLTYRFLEVPIRRSPRGARPVVWLLACTAALVLAASACFVGAIPARSRATTELAQRGLKRDEQLRNAFHEVPCDGLVDVSPRVKKFCSVVENPSATSTLVLWGDSHARAWSPAIFELGQKRGYRVVLISHQGCAPLLGVRRGDPDVDEACRSLGLAEDVLRTVAAAKPSQIYMAARWNIYAYGWKVHGKLQSLTHFLTQNEAGPADEASSQAALAAQFEPTVQALARVAPVTLIRTVPALSLPYEEGSERDPAHFEPTLAEHRSLEAISDRLIAAAAARPGDHLSVVDPASILCRSKCMAAIDGQLLYADDNHLTAQGAQLFEDQLWPNRL